MASMKTVRRGVAGHVGEGNDAYPNVVSCLDDKTRIIVCQDGIQWIVQKRNTRNIPSSMWVGVSFCRTREALLRCSGYPDHPILAALPEWCPSRRAEAPREGCGHN
jgi:hypothetical protein